MLNSILNSLSEDASLSLGGLLIALGVALLLGLAVSAVYLITNRKSQPSSSFALTLVMLPMVITVIILLVGNNVARAFSLAGAFSIIRFRSAPGNPKDISYVLFCMAIGLATGMGFVLYAAIVAVALCATMLLLEALGFGSADSRTKLLKISVPEQLDFQDAFSPILEKYTSNYSLQRIKTADLGSIYELSYQIQVRKGMSEKELIDDLRCRNGNLNISLLMAADKNDF